MSDAETSSAIQERLPFLKIEGLALDFAVYEGTVKVLDGIDLELRKGEILGIVGETGCGKTVTSKSINRLLEGNAVIKGGRITFMESPNLLESSEREMEKVRGRRISMIFQEPMTSLNPTMRIGDQVGEGLLVHFREDMVKKGLEVLDEERGILSGLYRAFLKWQLVSPGSPLPRIASRIPLVNRFQRYPKMAARRESVEILRAVDMPSPERIALSYPHELSGGMRQRVLMAIALACKPELVIADEPTTAVDVTTQAKLLRLIFKMRNEWGTTILIITHNLGVIAEICDRVCVMYAGQVDEVGGVSDVIKHPLHPYTRGLMGAIHNIGDKKDPEEIPGVVPILLNPPPGCRFHPRCAHAMDICRAKRPVIKEEHGGHYVYCWLYPPEK